MTINEILTHGTVEAVKELYGAAIEPQSIQVTATRREFEGNLTIVVFPLVRFSRKAPDATASELGGYLTAHCDAVAAFNVVKGFLNIVIKPSFWTGVLAGIASAGDAYGVTAVTPSSPTVMVEYSSPNTNKPLHLGHIRNNLLGYSLSLILEACGNHVVKTNIVNDRGIHICKSMLAWQRWGNGATPESTGKKGDHLIGDFYVAFDAHYKQELRELMDGGMTQEEAEAASTLMADAREMLRRWEDGDEEVRRLWAMMNQWVYDGFDVTYKRLGVSFDKIYYESQTYLVGKQEVERGLQQGIFYRKDDGSVWADLTGDGLDHKLLLRSDGTSVYMTQDIGTAKLRYADYPIDKMVYVVGNEQNYHFQVLSLLLDKLGYEWGKDLVHFSYGMVELPNGRMKSREGTVVDADDLMDTMIATAREKSGEPGRLEGLDEAEREEVLRIVGLGALKYFLLKVDPRKNIVFDPSESIDFNGNTGPFIQYTYARIQSLLRRADYDGQVALSASPNDKEVTLIQKLGDYPDVLAEAGKTYSPALLANYAYDLAREFNQYYHDYPVLREEDADVRSLRLVLCGTIGRTLRQSMALLGIEMPSRM